MGPFRTPALLSFYISLLVIGSGKGWAGSPPAFPPENQISELQFERNRALAALRESLAREKEIAGRLQKAQAEKEEVLAETAQKSAAVRYLTEQVQKLNAGRADLEKSVAEIREAERKRKENSAKLMELATNSSEELTGLRQRLESTAAERARVGVENQTLQKQLTTTTQELEELKAELTRSRAVVRAFQEKVPEGGGSAVETALRARIDELELNLAKAIAQGVKPGGETSGEVQAAATASPAAAADPESLWKSFLSLLAQRGEDALGGKFQGDAFDWTVISVAGAAVLLPGLLYLSMKRSRNLRRQLKRIRTGKDHHPAVSRAAPAEEPSPRPSSRVEVRPAPPAKAPSSRNVIVETQDDRDFSAIISSPKRTKSVPDSHIIAPAAPAVSSSQKASEPARGTQIRTVSIKSSPKPPEAPEPRRSASYRVTARPGPAQTAERTVVSADRPPAPPAKAPVRQEAPPPGEDKDLLDDLKAEISRKIDELIQ